VTPHLQTLPRSLAGEGHGGKRRSFGRRRERRHRSRSRGGLSLVGEAAGKVAEIAYQVHGAIGFTHEHSLHRLTRRLWSWRDEFGNESHWSRELGRAVMTAGADVLWPTIAAG
jgi:alkylation response protein AidB-like acyl-CoA dehydrogenase